MNGTGELIGLEIFFRKTDLLITFLIVLLGIAFGIGLGLFGGAFTSSPALISALQFSPEREVIFGYGVGYPFGLLGVIVFVTIATRMLHGRMQAEIQSRSRLHSGVYRVVNDAVNGRPIRDIEMLRDRDVVVSGILRDLSIRTASGSTPLLVGDVVRLEGTAEAVDEAGGQLGEALHEEFVEDSELDTRSIVVENTAVVNRSIRDLGIGLRFNVSITRKQSSGFGDRSVDATETESPARWPGPLRGSGGGGGSRTPVREPFDPGSTCLARSIFSRRHAARGAGHACRPVPV